MLPHNSTIRLPRSLVFCRRTVGRPQSTASRRSYHLVLFDEKGSERPNDKGDLVSKSLETVLGPTEQPITDVFLFSHGWKNDIPAAKACYKQWIGAMAQAAPQERDIQKEVPDFKPLAVGIHWPSLPWGSEAIWDNESGRVDPQRSTSAAFSPEMVAKNFGGDHEAREAVRTIFEFTGRERHRADDGQYPVLPNAVVDAYGTLYRASGLSTNNPKHGPGAEQKIFDPQEIVRQAVRSLPQDGFPSDPTRSGILDQTAMVVLSPLIQLSFWQMQERAQQIGETGVNQLLRRLQSKSAPNTRFHLMGHSFGCIVMSAALLGSYEHLQSVHVHSLFLVQAAMSRWSFANQVPHGDPVPGHFNRVVKTPLVDGTLVATQAARDRALSYWYPLGTLHRAIGTHGVQGVQDILTISNVRGFPVGKLSALSRGVHNVDASSVMRAWLRWGGAHCDIVHPEIAQLFWNMVFSNRR